MGGGAVATRTMQLWQVGASRGRHEARAVLLTRFVAVRDFEHVAIGVQQSLHAAADRHRLRDGDRGFGVEARRGAAAAGGAAAARGGGDAAYFMSRAAALRSC